MTLSVLQLGAEAAPVFAGDLGESTTALAAALAERGVPVAQLALLPHDADPPAGFARRLARLAVAGDALEVFEGSLTRGVPCWLLRCPPGRDTSEVLLHAAAGAVEELDIAVTVAHAHGSAAAAALDGIGRVRPSAVRVATVVDPSGADAFADAVVVPGREATGGALAIEPGIDDTLWNPETDGLLPARYCAKAPEGKQTCRRALQRALGLPPRADVPIFAISSPRLRERFAEAIGSGRAVAAQIASPADGVSLRAVLGAADFFVADEHDDAGVLRALRYGVVPLAPEGSAAGARIVEYDEPSRTGQGLLFTDETVADCAFRAGRIHADPLAMAGLRDRALRADVSWRGPSQRYLDLFERLSRE